jgi:hypothetical protein
MMVSRWVYLGISLLAVVLLQVVVLNLMAGMQGLQEDEQPVVQIKGHQRDNQTSKSTPALQVIARQGLKTLQYNQHQVFRLLEIQALDEISQRGFVTQWGKCVLANAWRHPTRPLQVVLLGGSSSARPADHCGSEEDPRSGRYSNILQADLQQQLQTEVTVHNMAQGSTTSIWNGLVLEHLLPPKGNVDLLIWEHAINDHAQSAEGDPHDMLRFWLSRVQHVFRKNPLQSRTPPPILILYLWKQDIGYRQNHHIHSK